MTVEALGAAETLHHTLVKVAATFTEAEWQAPSACPGWRVQDVIAHMAVGARAQIDPIPFPEDWLPPPSNRERAHDMHVQLRRDWSAQAVFQEFEDFSTQRLSRLPALVEEPAASTEIEIPGLGSYPMHAVLNALAFDYYCHLYHDICGPLGPIERDLPEVSDKDLYAIVQWMMWGLPQMQGSELDEALFEPITIRLTGPGQSAWTIRRSDEDGRLIVDEGETGGTIVTSSAVDFVSWGTGRTPWHRSCQVQGNPMAATAFLSTLNIV